MAVLQAYQADLLKDLNEGKGLSPEAVTDKSKNLALLICAPPPSRSRRGKSTANKGKQDLRDVLTKKRGSHLRSDAGAP